MCIYLTTRSEIDVEGPKVGQALAPLRISACTPGLFICALWGADMLKEAQIGLEKLVSMGLKLGNVATKTLPDNNKHYKAAEGKGRDGPALRHRPTCSGTFSVKQPYMNNKNFVMMRLGYIMTFFMQSPNALMQRPTLHVYNIF